MQGDTTSLLTPADFDEIVGLCLQPSELVEPVVFRGSLKDTVGFFSEADLQAHIHNDELRMRAGIFPTQDWLRPDDDPEAYTPDGIARHRRDGSSLVFRGLQRRQGAVRDLCVELYSALLSRWMQCRLDAVRHLSEEAVKWQLYSTVHAVLIETHPGVQALEAHWDCNPVVVFQVDGYKKWSVYRPFTYHNNNIPELWDGLLGGQAFTERQWQRLSGEPDQVVTLAPGDVYVVPEGWGHRAVAVDGPSLAISVCPLSQQVVDKFGNEDHAL